MEKTVDLKLDNNEEILAKGVKKRGYFIILLLISLLLPLTVCYFWLFIPLKVLLFEKCVISFIAILEIWWTIEFYNSYKYYQIYITNKRFIITKKDKIEKISFDEVRNFHFIQFYISNLYIKNKSKITFVCNDIYDVYQTFTKLCPQWKPKMPKSEIIIGVLLLILIIIFQIAYAHKDIILQKIKNTEIENITEDSDAQTYMNYLQSTMYSNWKPPKLKHSTKVVTFFEIAPDGTISNEKILQSSGNKEMDDSALLAIRKISPIKKLPKALLKETPTVQFTFDYNVYKH